MTKYYHVIIEKKAHWSVPEKEVCQTRQEIICKGKVRCPEGWRIVGVCGYHEEPTETRNSKKEDFHK